MRRRITLSYSLLFAAWLLLHRFSATLVSGNKLDPPPPPPPPPPPRLPPKTNTTATKYNASKSKRASSEADSKDRVVVEDIQLNSTQKIVQLTETEIYDGTKWRAPGSIVSISKKSRAGEPSMDGRWTKLDEDDEDNKAAATKRESYCAPPAKQKPPKGFQWEGDWKILTSTFTRDSFGWEYSHAGRGPYPTRRRVWLRTLVPSPVKTSDAKSKKHAATTKNETTSSLSATLRRKTRALVSKRKSSSSSASKKGRPGRKLPRWMRAVADDFNFRGFSVTFWKGIVFPKSFGVSFRLPLTQNFARWDGNAALPSSSLLVGFFYPPMAAIYISGNFRLAYLQWCCFQAYSTVQYIMLYMIWTFYRGLLLALSAVAFPVTRKLVNPPLPVQPPWVTTPAPIFRRDVDERIGCSYSWRVSASRGFYTTLRAWHYYAPTISSLYKAVEQQSARQQQKQKWLPRIRLPEMPAWIARHTAELGLDVSGPLDEEPYLSGSAGLAMNGFYPFRTRGEKVRVTTTSQFEDEDVRVVETEEDEEEKDKKKSPSSKRTESKQKQTVVSS